MGDLLLSWLNDEVQLTKRISSFEEDFHSGYLLGELLAKHSQQLNFHQFLDADDKASRVKNFSLLLDSLSALRVTYDAQIAHRIIEKKFGVAKKLLYEIKTQLERAVPNGRGKSAKTLSPLKKIQVGKEKYDSVQREHFLRQLNELHPAQKEILQTRHLAKFGDFHSKSLQQAAQAEQKQRQARLLLRTRFNEQQRDNLKKSEDFRKQWEADHLQKWSANMSIRQGQLSKDSLLKTRLQDERSQARALAQTSAINGLSQDIANFEKKHLKRGGDSSEEEQERGEDVGKVGVTVGQERGRKVDERARHQRQKRRRKMIVEQQKCAQMIEVSRRERCMVATIEQTSRQQKEIQYEIWRAWQNKSIIIENRILNDEKTKEKSETRAINGKFKKEQLLKLLRQQHSYQLDQALQNYKKLGTTHQVDQRRSVYGKCQNLVLSILDIAQELYASCQDRNTPQFDSALTVTALTRFVEDSRSPEQTAALELKHYIEGTHAWSFPVVRGQEEPVDPAQDNALPPQSVNNFYLGNILRTIYNQLLGGAASHNPSSSPQRLFIALIGLDFAGKHTLARALAQKYNFSVIEVDKLLQQRVVEYQMLTQKGLGSSQEGEQLTNLCLRGKPIPDSLVVQLVAAEIQKHPRAVLVDYPTTYEQAVALTRALGGPQPQDGVGEDKLKKRISEFSRLARCSQARIVERELRECGVDFVWWMEVPIRESVDRMLGRRWIGDKVVHISSEIDNPRQLQTGQKSSALLMRNHFKAKHLPQLQGWFSLFGTQFDLQGQKYSQPCWERVNAISSPQDILKSGLEKAQKTLFLKERQAQYSRLVESQKAKAVAKKFEQEAERAAIKAKCVLTPSEAIRRELTAALVHAELQKEFVQVLSELWNKTEASTVSALGRAFSKLKQVEGSRRRHLAEVKRNFIGLLTRQDQKSHLIKQFQQRYNKFVRENEDMLAQQHTKEELHQRVEDLENDLLAVLEEKKEDAATERAAIVGSGWLEAQLDTLSECLYVLVQTELNRYAASEKIILDFYAKKYMVPLRGLEPLNPELSAETINAVEPFKEGVSPRLEKLIGQALRVFNREQEVVDDKNKKGGKAPPAKKQEKKGAKKGGKEQVQQKSEVSAEELEMKKAINTEKAIFRQRINKLKTFGGAKIKQTWQSAQKLYGELQELYVYAIRVESKAVANLARIFRRAIEKEQKIESEVQLRHVQVTQTERIRNFPKEKPVILPAREAITDQHFSLAHLHQLLKLLRAEAEGSRIATKRLLVLLTRLIENQQLRKILPSTWKSLTPKKIEKFVQLLDASSAAYVDLVKVFAFAVLSGYTIPTPPQLEQYTHDLTGYGSLKEIGQEKFLKVEAWFDSAPIQQQNIRPFQRHIFVKELLFNIFKRETDHLVDIGRYLTALNLQDLPKEPEQGTTYFQYAFQ